MIFFVLFLAEAFHLFQCSRLRTLRLHDNNLAEVPTPAWLDLAHLERLTMGRNPLRSLPPAAWNGLPKLQVRLSFWPSMSTGSCTVHR